MTYLRPVGQPDGPHYEVGDRVESPDARGWTITSITGPETGFTTGFPGRVYANDADDNPVSFYPNELGLVIEE